MCIFRCLLACINTNIDPHKTHTYSLRVACAALQFVLLHKLFFFFVGLLFVVICNYASFDYDFTYELLHRCGAAGIYVVRCIGLLATAINSNFFLLIWTTYMLFIIPFVNTNSNVAANIRIYSKVCCRWFSECGANLQINYVTFVQYGPQNDGSKLISSSVQFFTINFLLFQRKH